MTDPDAIFTADELQRQREGIRRGLARANIAAALIIFLVVMLAIGAIWAAYRADQNAQLTARANREAKNELWKSYLAQARASRTSGVMGRRVEGLAAVVAAAKMRPSVALRNEAIGLLALTDLEEEKFWPQSPGAVGIDVDAKLERYVWRDHQGVCHLHRFADNQSLMALPGPDSEAGFCQFSPDGRLLAARYANDQVWIWELTSQQPIVRLQLEKGNGQGIFGLAFSPDSKLLAVGEIEARRVRLFDARTGEERKRLTTGLVESIDFHPSESKCATASRGSSEVQIFDWDTQQLVDTKKHTSALTNVRWSQDGRLLSAGSGNGEVIIWDLVNNTKQVLAGHTTLSVVQAFGRPGTILVSSSWDGTSRLWDSGSGRMLLSAQSGDARQLSLDGRRLGFVRSGSGVGYWRLFTTPFFHVLHVAGGAPTLFSSQVSADGNFVAVSKSDGVHVLELANGREVQHLPLPYQWAQMVSFQPDGKTLIASGTEGLSFWPMQVELSHRRPQIQFGARRLLPKPPGTHEIQGAKVLSDGRHAIESLDGYHVVLVDLETGQYGPVLTNHLRLASMAISPDTKWVVTSTHGDRPSRIWDTSTGRIFQEVGAGALGMNFSPDGQWLVTSGANEIAIRDVKSWRPRNRFVRSLATGQPGQPVFSPDSRWLAFAETERVVKLAATETGELIAECRAPHDVNISAIEFSADGRNLLVCTGNDELLVWDLPVLRAELAVLGLDWQDGGSPAERHPPAGDFLTGPVTTGPFASRRFNQLVVVTVFGVILAMSFALFVFQRHRLLIRSYAQIETVVEQRNRELKLAQADLLHGQKMKALGTLAAGIAHDFNNLLSVIRMSNELIEEAKDKRELRGNVAEIEQAVLQGKAVVRSMLGYSRDTTGDVCRYLVCEVVQDLLALLSKQFLSGLTLKLDLDAALLVHGDRRRLEQILLNLVVNAAEAMKGTGELSLKVSAQRIEPAYVLRPRSATEYVEVIVADSGPGIDAQLFPRIFDPFFTTKSSSATRGTGLGLSTVYSIAETDGLGISVESVAGRGATFRITIPVK
jgi:signal transduction histidine kinase/Tol biopolymer transport system component